MHIKKQLGLVLSFIFAGVYFALHQSGLSVSLLTAYVAISGIVIAVVGNTSSTPGKQQKVVNDIGDDSTLSTLYVGNLPYKANEEAVKSFFSDVVSVKSVRLMRDKKTGKRKGYGFVEVVTHDTTAIIDQLNDASFQDRTIKVRPAKEKTFD